MGPWSRVRVAKCQMLVTSLFVLVTGRLGRGGGAGVGVGVLSRVPGPLELRSPPRPHQPCRPGGHAPGALVADSWQQKDAP